MDGVYEYMRHRGTLGVRAGKRMMCRDGQLTRSHKRTLLRDGSAKWWLFELTGLPKARVRP
jgi:hypothetical protein